MIVFFKVVLIGFGVIGIMIVVVLFERGRVLMVCGCIVYLVLVLCIDEGEIVVFGLVYIDLMVIFVFFDLVFVVVKII